MNEHDFSRFSALMLGLAENFGQSLSSQGIALRFRALAEYGIDEVEQAALSLMLHRKYASMPTVAELLEHVQGGSVEDKAEVEVGKVLIAISAHGSYASVVFDDAVTQAVIVQAYGGWVKLCADCGTEEPEKWFRKDFARIWAAYSRQGVQRHGYLPGRTEIANGSKGCLNDIPTPVLIGNQDKARAVLKAGKALDLVVQLAQGKAISVSAQGDR